MRTLAVLLAVGATLGALWSAVRALDASAECGRTSELLRQARSEIQWMRESRSALLSGPRPSDDSDLTRRVTATMAIAGLPPAALTGLNPQPAQSVGNSRDRDGRPVAVRRAATLTIDGAALPTLGRFLEAWRVAEPAWTITQIDLTASPRSRTPESRNLPLRAIFTMEAVTVAAPSPSGANTPGKESS